MNQINKNNCLQIIREKLSQCVEVDKVIVFGSFLSSSSPHDIDIAIIQNSNQNFLTLSLKYRKVLRELSQNIPLDIIPIKKNAQGVFMQEINEGRVIYER